MKQKLEQFVKQVLSESAKIKFAGHSFILKVDTNEDPNKKGVKIQFLPTEFGKITPTEQNDIAIELESRLEKGLSEFDMRVERDRNLKDKTIIGFFIYIEYFDRIVSSLKQGKKNSDPAFNARESVCPSMVKMLQRKGASFGLKFSVEDVTAVNIKHTATSVMTAVWMEHFFSLTGDSIPNSNGEIHLEKQEKKSIYKEYEEDCKYFEEKN